VGLALEHRAERLGDRNARASHDHVRAPDSIELTFYGGKGLVQLRADPEATARREVTRTGLTKVRERLAPPADKPAD